MQVREQIRARKRGGNVAFIVTLILLVAGIVVPLAIAPVGAVLIFLIFTIPLYALLAVLPLMCMIGLGALLSGRLIRRGPWPYIAGAALATVALMAVPYQSNPKAHQAAQNLVAGDKLAVPAPVRTGSIALIHPAARGYRPDDSLCGDLCRTLLLDGRAKTVLVALDEDTASGFKPGLKAVAYALESRTTCPDIGKRASDLPGEATSAAIGQRSDDRLNLAMANGKCLVARPGLSGEADVAAVYGYLASRSDPESRWFSHKQFSAHRVSLWRRAGSGYAEYHRHTYVTYDVFFPILMPTIILDGISSHAGFARQRIYVRNADRWVTEPPVAERLLGVPEKPGAASSLAVKAEVTRDTRQAVVRALDAATPPSPVELEVAGSYMQSLTFDWRKDAGPENTGVAVRLLSDARFPVTNAASGFVRNAKVLSPAQTSAIARSMFARLHAMEAGLEPYRLDGQRFEEASAIGSVIEFLPAEDILRHRADLLWLTRQQTLRAPAYRALLRLDLVSGGDAFLYLIDDSDQFGGDRGDDRRDDRYRQHPYLAGIEGMCKLGASASAFKPALIARIGNGTISRDGSYGDTVFDTLVAMGVSREELARLFKGSSNFVRVSYERSGGTGPKRKVTTDVPIDRAYERALRRKDCAY